ncbi:helix-turn-helix transcriptional regulator [Archangium violaceum]|uniref:helix-turn-helix domain-containing protein n=1 Tax=Archangium violaceum TaxID=83451 RepID=UPI0019501079|nr:helix-turn-helix domain-containing protein [Archangium violaceum]QRN98005.1 helix-turn-helix transcriptional regulator [Archangium violaceum]
MKPEAHRMLTPPLPLDQGTPSSVLTPPPPELSGQIDLCWATSGCTGAGTSFHELLPDAGGHLIFRHSPRGCRLVLLGPTTERATVEREAGAEYLGIHFRPGQVPRLADVRSSELTNGFVELTRLGGMPIDSVAERLRALPDLASRQRALAELLRGEAPPLVTDARCRRATRLLEAHGGRLRVDELAAELGLHVRSLERLFLEHHGMTPKRMSRLVRLWNVFGALYSGTYGNLAELAQECGYSDQPHLIRDFKALTDRLPGEKDAFQNRRLERAETRVVHRHRP